MRRFIAGLGSTAVWPVVARAQQAAMPVIGYLSSRSRQSDASMLVALRRGLNETGFIEGRNFVTEYRFADGQYERVPALLAELTDRQPAVIVLVGAASDEVLPFLRASPIPIVFVSGRDPVRRGLVSSLSRPGGNLTGISVLLIELTGKRLGLLHELLPNAKSFALLDNAILENPRPTVQRDAGEVAAKLGVQLRVLNATNEGEIDAAFSAANERRPDAMLVANSPFFLVQAERIAALAARYRVPAIYARREFTLVGGLMSYGYDVADAYRHAGNYAGRILNGEKPADLPVQQPTKFELVINLKTAKALGLTIPETLLATADEVIQ
jgi:putative ABC transport system substrate-binding protein